MQTDFPEPVVPAINKCGIEFKSPTIGRPEMLLPRALVQTSGGWIEGNQCTVSPDFLIRLLEQ